VDDDLSPFADYYRFSTHQNPLIAISSPDVSPLHCRGAGHSQNFSRAETQKQAVCIQYFMNKEVKGTSLNCCGVLVTLSKIRKRLSQAHEDSLRPWRSLVIEDAVAMISAGLAPLLAALPSVPSTSMCPLPFYAARNYPLIRILSRSREWGNKRAKWCPWLLELPS
jgi:hypothetical protein